MSITTARPSQRARPESGVVFCGLARNCAHTLPHLLSVVAEIGQAAGDWAYVFLESDSYDDTMAILESFHEAHPDGIVRSYGRLREQLPERTSRLARLRNEYLDLCAASGYLERFRNLVVLDLDAVNEDLRAEPLLERLIDSDPSWAALFANQSERYYDIWALRQADWSPDDCWERVRSRPSSMTEAEAVRRFVEARQIRIPSDADRIEVDSAFGGLGIYRTQWLRDTRYSGTRADGASICEHVPFHAKIRARGGRLFIDPGLVNGTGVQPHKAGFLLRAAAWLRARSPWATGKE